MWRSEGDYWQFVHQEEINHRRPISNMQDGNQLPKSAQEASRTVRVLQEGVEGRKSSY